VEHGLRTSSLQHLLGRTTVFHFSWNQRLVCAQPCPIFHVTKPLARCAGSMKSGTRFCAQSNFRRPHKKRICFGSGRAESASVLRAIARPNIADMRSRNFCATAREADMRSRNFCATAREADMWSRNFCATTPKANYVVAQFLRDHSQSRYVVAQFLRDHPQSQ